MLAVSVPPMSAFSVHSQRIQAQTLSHIYLLSHLRKWWLRCPTDLPWRDLQELQLNGSSGCCKNMDRHPRHHRDLPWRGSGPTHLIRGLLFRPPTGHPHVPVPKVLRHGFP